MGGGAESGVQNVYLDIKSNDDDIDINSNVDNNTILIHIEADNVPMFLYRTYLLKLFSGTFLWVFMFCTLDSFFYFIQNDLNTVFASL